VAIRAQKHALLSLFAQLRQGERDSFQIDFVSLLRWLEVVEVERSHIAVISTDAAASAGLGHENCLDLPASAGYPVRSALPTAVVAASLEDMWGLAVPSAHELHREQPGILRGASL
jgi:hypothetical protein